MTFDPERVFRAMGHCWPMDEFSESEVAEVATALEASPVDAWRVYEAALAEAQDAAPPKPTMG